jgi:hypothetical protein
MSAAEQQLVGCPLPASVVDVTLKMRNWAALWRKVSMEVADNDTGGLLIFPNFPNPNK